MKNYESFNSFLVQTNYEVWQELDYVEKRDERKLFTAQHFLRDVTLYHELSNDLLGEELVDGFGELIVSDYLCRRADAINYCYAEIAKGNQLIIDTLCEYELETIEMYGIFDFIADDEGKWELYGEAKLEMLMDLVAPQIYEEQI